MNSDDQTAQIYNLEKYMGTEAGRLREANVVEREEILHEIDECLDELTRLGRYAIAPVIDLNANIVPIRPDASAA